MKTVFSTLIALMLIGCHTGDLGERCNRDATCNAPGLECDWRQYCDVAKPVDRTPKRCVYESECFCITCADKCGDAGVKACNYSDTSVWGSKPAVCECKP